MKRISLTRGQYAIVDDDDYLRLSKHKWCLSHYGYAHRGKYFNGKHLIYWMHREIINAPKGQRVDHINGNPLDNRKANLRLCTHQQNMSNVRVNRANNVSGFKGVYYFGSPQKRLKRWKAEITVNYKNISLGYFETKEEAAKAYNEAAVRYFGEYARLNSI